MKLKTDKEISDAALLNPAVHEAGNKSRAAQTDYQAAQYDLDAAEADVVEAKTKLQKCEAALAGAADLANRAFKRSQQAHAEWCEAFTAAVRGIIEAEKGGHVSNLRPVGAKPEGGAE